MKTFRALGLAASIIAAASPVGALHLGKRLEGAPRVVGMEIHRSAVENPAARDRIRRRGTVQGTLDNLETLYFVNATIGTPAQSVRLHIDTGSSDLWVNTPSSTLCSSVSNSCSFAGTYTANSSSTYSYVGSYFNISYVDGSGATGDYATDTVTIGGKTLAKLQFGIGYTSSSAQGILGVGYELNEVQVGRAGMSSYANLPAQMVSDGLIASNAYSLWLNDLNANTGSIMFGGVDTDKFEGTLKTLPIQAESNQFAEFLVTLTSVTLGSNTIAKSQALAVLLDSGSSLTYLPDAWASSIYNDVSAEYDANEGAAFVPCSLAKSNKSLVYSFSGVEIPVSMSELVLDLQTSSGRRPTFSNGQPACLFGIAPSGSSTNVLGDTFLRSAYVVYDLANNEISLAPTKFNVTTSNVLEIGTGNSAVPSATAAANPVAATEGLSTIVSTSNRDKSDAGSIHGAGASALAAVVAFTVGVIFGL